MGPLSQPYDVCLSVETDLDSGVAFDLLIAAQQLLHEAGFSPVVPGLYSH